MHAAPATPPPEKGELLVAWDPTARTDGRLERAHDRAGGRPVERFEEIALDVVAVDDVDRAMAEYAKRPGVRYVELNGTVGIAGANDPLYQNQWHLQPRSGSNRGTANVEGAWSRTKGSGIVVAVVDTGVRKGGSDLDSSRVLTGRNFVSGGDDATDDHGHGTHIAGTVAQSTNNGKGAAGVAPAAKILPVKVLNAAGAGTYADVIDGVLWAKDRAHVINLSLSGATYSRALCDAMANAARSALVVAAAGNDGIGSVSYPAACDAVVAVGAVRYDGQRAPYSNRGSQLELAAPGGDLGVDQDGDGYGDGVLQQTFSGGWGYMFFEGTSMASAHVSGVGALVLSLDRKADVRGILRATARDLGPSGRDTSFGYGALDAVAAVAAVKKKSSSPSPAPAPAPSTTTTTTTSTTGGYWLASTTGQVQAFGSAKAFGSIASAGARVVAIEEHPKGAGYWLLDEAGAVHAFGNTRFLGSVAQLRGQGAAVGGARALDLASTPSGNGYWILDEAGGIFTFGDARFFGSVPGLRQSGVPVGPARVVDIASTPSGNGYWILDEVGGMFAFGDARFFGSVPGLRGSGVPVGPAVIVGMAPTRSGKGYWLVDDQGGMFAFGDAQYRGSLPALRQAGHAIGPTAVVAMEPTRSGEGYWLVDGGGGIFTFGDAPFHGSFPGVGMAVEAAGIAPTG